MHCAWRRCKELVNLLIEPSSTAVIKLGGSFLTDKASPFVARVESIKKVASALKQFEGRIAIVHGGGSFGHPVALKFGLSSSSMTMDAEAIFQTRKAMLQLSEIISSVFEESGLKTYTLPAAAFLQSNKRPRRDTSLLLKTIMRAGMVPLTFGDVVPYNGEFTIVSGDYLSYIFCKQLKAKMMAFLIDKPGILADVNDRSSVIRTINYKTAKKVLHDDEKDATGGMLAKISAASKISSLGTKTAIISGFDTDALISFLSGGEVQGTLVSAKR